MTGSASFVLGRNVGVVRGANTTSLRKERLPVNIRRRPVTHVCRAMARSGQQASTVTITSLRKLNKAQLVSKAQQLELEDNGTKEDLVGRLLAAHNTSTGTYKLRRLANKEDVELLQAEVADLDAKLGALSLTLAETTAAREVERHQLASIIADMTNMRDQWQRDVQLVESLSFIAGDLEQSERDILTLRGQQGRFAERIALMQRLLKDRQEQVVLLTAQLSNSRQPALALAGSASLWESAESSAVADQPLSYTTFSAPTWANEWDAPTWGKGVLPSGEETAARNTAQSSAVHSTGVREGLDRQRSSRQHKAPALAIVAALQKGGEAWNAVKSILPQDKRFMADVVLAMGATAAYMNMFF